MATKDHLSFKDDSKTFVNSNSKSQYSNLNLNNSSKCSTFSTVRSQSVSMNKKSNEKPSSETAALNEMSDSTNENFENSKARDCDFWQKQNNPKPFENLSPQKSEKERSSLKRRSKSSNANGNSSTLSLHITAYENSIEAAKSKSEDCQKTDFNKKNPTAATSSSSFHFPRQPDKEIKKPETMPFKASQKLLNTNSSPKLSPQKYDDDGPPILTKHKPFIEDTPPILIRQFVPVLQRKKKMLEDSASESSDINDDASSPPPILNREVSFSMETDEKPPILEAIHEDKHDCGICHQSINNIDKKEQFSAGGFKKGDSQKTDEWIHCDQCHDWFHLACANIEEFETKLLDIYHCKDCEKFKGPSKMKQIIVPHRYDFWDENERNKNTQIGTKTWIDSFITREADYPEFSDLKIYDNGYQFNGNFDFEKEWQYPLKVLDKDGLNMKIPGEDFTVKKMVELVGRDEVVQVIDVFMQESNSMSMGAFYDRWEAKPRERLYNMLSFEFSHTKLMDIIRAPDLMYKLSWVHRFWPLKAIDNEFHIVEDEHLQLKPDVAMFALLGMGGSYTDFHIDFGGSSVWYHVFKGQKVFYVIEPRTEYLRAFVEWTNGPKRNEQFLNDLIPDRPMKRVVINEGETLMIPSGWIHAVYTPVDSIVFGGNFVHELNITRQLQVYDIELKCNYDEQFLFPSFELTNWYAAFEALDRFGSFGPDSLSPAVIEGFRTLIPYLKKWVQRDKDKSPDYKVHNVFRDTIQNLEGLIKNYDKNMEDEPYDPENDRRASLKLKIKVGGGSLNGSPKKIKDKSFEKAEQKIQKLGKKDSRYVSNMFQKGQTQSGRTPKPSEWLKESVVGFESQPGPSSNASKNFFNNFSAEEKKLIDNAAKADDPFSKAHGDTPFSSSDDDDFDDKVLKKKRKLSKDSKDTPKIPKTPKPPKIQSQQSRIMKKLNLLKKRK